MMPVTLVTVTLSGKNLQLYDDLLLWLTSRRQYRSQCQSRPKRQDYCHTAAFHWEGKHRP